MGLYSICTICTNDFLKGNLIWQDVVTKISDYQLRKYGSTFFGSYDSVSGLKVCQVCILAYKVLLRSTFGHWGQYRDIDFEKCETSIIIDIVGKAPHLHHIFDADMGDLFSNALNTKNEKLLIFILSLEEYNICQNFFDAVSVRSPLGDFFVTIASAHPRYEKFLKDKDTQN